jgi:hypothetical protein
MGDLIVGQEEAPKDQKRRVEEERKERVEEKVSTTNSEGKVTDKELAESYALKNDDAVYCEDCFAVFIFDRLPEDNIIKSYERHEFWGAPAYELIITGFACPECGHLNTL